MYIMHRIIPFITPSREGGDMLLVGLAPFIELSGDLFMRNRPAGVEILDTLCDLPALPLVRLHIGGDGLCHKKRFRPLRLRRKVLKALLHVGV
jgi:hypothetical protein